MCTSIRGETTTNIETHPYLIWVDIFLSGRIQKNFLIMVESRAENEMSWLIGFSETSEVTLEWVNYTGLKAINSYNSICTSNKWNIPIQGRVNYC